MLESLQGLSVLLKDYGLAGAFLIYLCYLFYLWLKAKGKLDKADPIEKLTEILSESNSSITHTLEDILKVLRNGHVSPEEAGSVKSFAYGLRESLKRLLIKAVLEVYTNIDRYTGDNTIKEHLTEEFTRIVNDVDDNLADIANIKDYIKPKEEKIKILITEIPIFVQLMHREPDVDAFTQRLARYIENIIKNRHF